MRYSPPRQMPPKGTFSLTRSPCTTRGLTDRTLLIWFFVAVGFVLLVTIAVLLNRHVWDNRVEEKIAQLASAGYPMSEYEIQRRHEETIPEENAADIYEKAFAAAYTGYERDNEWLPYYGQAASPEPGQPLEEETAKAIRQFLQQNTEAVGYFLEASRMADCAFPITVSFGGSLLSEHVGPVRDGARILSLKTILDLHEGRVEEAAETASAILRMSDHLRNEPFLIGALSRMALIGIGMAQVEQVLHASGLTDEMLASMQAAVASAEDEFLIANGLEAEVAFGVHMFRNMSDWYGHPSGPVEYFSDGYWIYHSYSLLGQTGRDLFNYLERMETAVSQARGPLLDRPAQSATWSSDEPTWSEFIQGRWMTNQMGISVERLFYSEKMTVARVRAGLAGLAARRYQLRHGDHPPDLTTLVGEYLEPAQIIDPFSGAPLAYSVDGDGFSIEVEGEVVAQGRFEALPE